MVAELAFEPASANDIPSIASLYVETFANNHAYNGIFLHLDGAERRRALLWFFERRLRASLAAGNPFLVGRQTQQQPHQQQTSTQGSSHQQQQTNTRVSPPPAAGTIAAADAQSTTPPPIAGETTVADAPNTMPMPPTGEIAAADAPSATLVSPSGGDNATVVAAGGLVFPHMRPGKLAMLWHGLAVWPLLWGWASLGRLIDLDARLSSGGVGAREGDCELVMLAVSPRLQGRGLGSFLLRQLMSLAASAQGEGSMGEGTAATVNVGGGMGESTAAAVASGGSGADSSTGECGTGVGGLSGGGSAGSGAGGDRGGTISCRVRLSTQDPRNLSFYERHGFKRVGSTEVRVSGADQPFVSWSMAREL